MIKINIYNKKTYKSDLKIEAHLGKIFYIIAIKLNILADSSYDKDVKLFKTKSNNCGIIQSIGDHKDEVRYILELNNKKLVSYVLDDRFTIY